MPGSVKLDMAAARTALASVRWIAVQLHLDGRSDLAVGLDRAGDVIEEAIGEAMCHG